MTPSPPRSTHFPSTTLFRSGDFDSSDDGSRLFISSGGCPQGTCTGPSSITIQSITGGPQRTIYNSQLYDVIDWMRSEEHTSELQSRRDLVCRLLLEKKNVET